MATGPTVELGAFRTGSVRIAPQIIRDLNVGMRHAVNESALAVVTDARKRLQVAIGVEQRMSGVVTRKRFDRGGETRRVLATTKAKGGTRINPYYRAAHSVTNPVALIGVRGPAQFIEHPRVGGYTIKPLRERVRTEGAVIDLAGIAVDLPGVVAKLKNPALRIPGTKGRASAKGGAISNPKAPITAAFTAAPRTIERAAAKTIRNRIGKR